MSKITLLLIFFISLLGCSYLGIEKIPETSDKLVSNLEQEEIVSDIEQEVIDEDYVEATEEEVADAQDFELVEDEEYDEMAQNEKDSPGFFESFFGGETEQDEVVDDREDYEVISDNIETEVIGDLESKDQQAQIREEEDYEEEYDFKEEYSEEDVKVSKSKKKNIPLQKIKTNSYQVGAYLVNGVYISRQDETLESISQKIYGSDKTEQLYAINPHLKSRSLVVGDKIYYNSPQRPTDNSRLLFYYEDIGMTPRVYTIPSGQNVRTVSTQLLGHKKSWKEIWATNAHLISKWTTSQEVVVSYWPQSSIDLPPQPDLPPEQPLAQAPVQEEEDVPSLPEEEIVESPSAASLDDTAQNQEPQDILELPPLAEEKKAEEKDIISLLKGLYTSSDRMAYLWKEKKLLIGLVGSLFVLYLILKILFRRRQKETEFDYTSPNIEV